MGDKRQRAETYHESRSAVRMQIRPFDEHFEDEWPRRWLLSLWLVAGLNWNKADRRTMGTLLTRL